MSERRYPPFTQIGMVSLALIVIGGIYLASHIPQHVPLGLPIALLIASAALVVVNLALLTRVPGFAWPRFFQVGKWALLAYLFTAGLIEFAFLQNHVKGGPLVDPDPVAARLRGPGPGAHRLHRRPLRRLLRRRRRRLARP